MKAPPSRSNRRTGHIVWLGLAGILAAGALTARGAPAGKALPGRDAASGLFAQASPGAGKAASAASLKDLKGQLERARKRGKPDGVADALYDLGKASYEAGDAAQAEALMRQSLEAEAGLKRPESAIRTRVALASILASLKRNDEALAVFKEALAVARSNNLSGQAVSIVDSMGALALVSGKLDEAERLFEQARDQAAAQKDPTALGGALINLAVLQRARGKPDSALASLNQALDALKDAGDDRVLAAAQAEMGHTQADRGDYDAAIPHYRQAIQLAKDQLDNTSAARWLLSVAQIYLTEDNPDQAYKAAAEARELMAEDKGQPVCTDILVALGSAQAGLGHFAEAEELHGEALERAQKSGDQVRQRTVLSELAYDYLLKGSPEQALDRYNEAYGLLGRQDPNNYKARGILLTDIAMCLKAVGQTAASASTYEMAVASFDQANDMPAKALALNSLAVAYLDAGMLAEFERYYEQAGQLVASLNDKKGQAILDYNLAQYRLAQAHPADAVGLYEQALDEARTAHDTRLEGQILRGMGLAYLCLGRAVKAAECYEQAQPTAIASGSTEAQWDCWLGLGKSYKAMGKTDQAIDALKKAADLVEQERSQLTRDTFKTYNLDLRQDCFMELVDALVKAGRQGEALEVAERGRARAFLDLLEGRRSRRPGDLVSGTSQSPAPNMMRLTQGETGSRGVEVLPRPVRTVEASAISPLNAKPPTLEELKTLVARNGSTFLEYYVLPDKVYMWVVRPSGEIEMPPPVVISRAMLGSRIAEAYQAVIAHPKSPGELAQLNARREAKLRDLYTLLVEPALSYLPRSADDVVTIVPHGPLFSVPFAAATSGGGRFLIEDHTLSFLPAIGVLRATQKLDEELKHATNRLLAFGNPITKAIAFLGALPYSETEVKHVAELFGPGAATVKIGADATRAAFVSLAPASSIIHLATHGLVDEEHPMDSALVLAPSARDDGLLTVKDILQLPALSARLVVLSACQTGRGKITGDGVVGLSRSFIIAGTPSIVVSQWNVDDVITEYQMVAFYKAFLGGAGKSKALRDAQLKTIALLEKTSESPRTPGSRSPRPATRANPRYWAAFQLIGSD